MKINKIINVVLIIFTLNSLNAFDLNLDFKSKQEQTFFADWLEHRSPKIDTLSAWLIADGFSDSVSINQFRNSFDTLFLNVQGEIDFDDDYEDKAEDVFKFLHKKVFMHIREDAKFSDIFLDGSYSSVTGSALYYLLCSKLDLPIELISSPFYTNTRLNLEKKIDIQITDKKRGFKEEKNKKDLLQLLLKLGVIEEDEYENSNIDKLFYKYFDFYDTIRPYRLMSTLYHNRGIYFIQVGNLELALANLEKAVIIDPDNEIYLENYKYTLYNLSDITTPYDKFLPSFENALWILNNDPTFVDVAILMSNKIIAFYVDDNREYQKALDLILIFKASFLNDKYLISLTEYEEHINFDWAWNLYSRGYYGLGYQKMKTIYQQNSDFPKYKDSYVEMSIKYAKKLIFKDKDYSSANRIMDSLYIVASDYPVVADAYVSTILAPFQQGYKYIQSNTQTSLKLAHKAFQISPENNLSRHAISRVYHEIAMEHIRKNNLEKAHRILVKGLKYLPGDKLLNEDLSQVENAY